MAPRVAPLLADRTSKVARSEPEPHDGVGAYTHEQLERMDARFCAAVERALASGDESIAGAIGRWR